MESISGMPYLREAERVLLAEGGLWRRLRAAAAAPEVPELRLALGCAAAIDRNADLWDELDGIKEIYAEVSVEQGGAHESAGGARGSLFAAAVEGIAAVLERVGGPAGLGEGGEGKYNCSPGASLLLFSSPEIAALVRKAITLESSYIVNEIQGLQGAIDRALDDGQLQGPPRPPQPSKSCLSPQRVGNVSKLRQRLSSSLEAAHGAPGPDSELLAAPPGAHDPGGVPSGKAGVFLKSRSTPHLTRDPVPVGKGTRPSPAPGLHGAAAASPAAAAALHDSGPGTAQQQRTFRNKLRAAKDENYLI